MPFPVRSIQVDSGSEFMADFESDCEATGIPLHEFFQNYRRPHWALDCRTPNEYLVGIEDAA